MLRSPHVNKDSREQFEVRMHQRLIDVKDLSSETVDRLMALDLPAGVDIEVRWCRPCRRELGGWQEAAASRAGLGRLARHGGRQAGSMAAAASRLMMLPRGVQRSIPVQQSSIRA